MSKNNKTKVFLNEFGDLSKDTEGKISKIDAYLNESDLIEEKLLKVIDMQLKTIELTDKALKEDYTNIQLFANELYDLSKIMVGILLPGFLGTFIIRDTPDNIAMIRLFIVITLIFFVGIIILRLYLLNLSKKEDGLYRKSRLGTLTSIFSLLTTLMKSQSTRNQYVNNKHLLLKNKSKKNN